MQQAAHQLDEKSAFFCRCACVKCKEKYYCLVEHVQSLDRKLFTAWRKEDSQRQIDRKQEAVSNTQLVCSHRNHVTFPVKYKRPYIKDQCETRIYCGIHMVVSVIAVTNINQEIT